MGFVKKGSMKVFLKGKKLRVATATYETLEKKFEEWLQEACERAKKNKRQTLMPQDL